MALWCRLQVIQKRNIQEISNAAQRLMCHASSSAYFYLFADKLWDQFGVSLLPLYLEMYIRGLTSDLNYFEIIRGSVNSAVVEIESHFDFIFTKLASLFIGKYDELAFECLLTAFSFNPSTEKLDQLKHLHEKLSLKNSQCTKLCKRTAEETNSGNNIDKYCECTCDRKYLVASRSNNFQNDSEEKRPIYTYHFPHLVLDSDLGKVPYTVLKDFVTVLECTRDWQLKLERRWEDTRNNCLLYLEKYINARKSFQQTSSYDSADSEMDSPSEGDDDISSKASKVEETVTQQLYKEPLKNELSKVVKSKTQQKQKYHVEENEVFEISNFAAVDNDLDKEMKKRKKKRKTKREKDRELSLKKQNTDDTQTIIVHKVKSNDTDNSKSNMSSLSHIATLDLANMSNHKVKIFLSESNSNVPTPSKSSEDVSQIISNASQTRNPVVVLSDILSDKLAMKGGRVNNKFNFHCSKGKEIQNLNKSDLEKSSIDPNYDELALSSSFLSNPDNILNSLQKVVGKKPILGNENDTICNETSNVKFPSSYAKPSSGILKNSHLYKALDGREPNYSTADHLTISQPINENVSSFQSYERSSSNINTEQKLNINETEVNENENLENKNDVENSKKTEESEDSNNSKIQLPVSNLSNKIRLQVDKASGIVPMPVATLTIPLPVGVQNSTGSKVLSGKLVIPVNTLQKAISASTPPITSTAGTTENVNNVNKSRMLSIPNVFVMKNVQNEINEEEKTLKENGSNTSSKQKRIWASVRNLHGSIEWRKVADRGNNLIKMSQKPQSSKSKSGIILTTQANFSTNETLINELITSSNIVNSNGSLFSNSESSMMTYENNSKSSDYVLGTTNSNEANTTKMQAIPLPLINYQESVEPDVGPINLSLPKNLSPEDLSSRRTSSGSNNDKKPYQTPVQDNYNNLSKTDKQDVTNDFSSASSSENHSSSTISSKSSPLISHLLSNTSHSNMRKSAVVGPFSSIISSLSKISHTYAKDQDHILSEINETFKRESLETSLDLKVAPKDYSFHYSPDYQVKKSNYLEGMQSSNAPPSEAAKLSMLVANNTNRLKNENMQQPLPIDQSYQYNTSTRSYTTTNSEQTIARQMFPVNNSHSNYAADKEDKHMYKPPVPVYKNPKSDSNNCNKRKISCKKNRASNTKLKVDNETTEREVQLMMGQIFNEMKNKGNFPSNMNNRNYKSVKNQSFYQRSKVMKNNNNEKKQSPENSKDVNDETEADKAEKKYGCCLCSSRLSHQYSLKRHYKSVHQIEVHAKDTPEKIFQIYEAVKVQNATKNLPEKSSIKNEVKEAVSIPSTATSQSKTFKTVDPVQSSEVQNNALPAIDVAFPNFNAFHQPNTQCSVSSAILNHSSAAEKSPNSAYVSDTVSISSCSHSNISSSTEWNQRTYPENIQEMNLNIHSKDSFDIKSSSVDSVNRKNNQICNSKNESFDVSKTLPCVLQNNFSSNPSSTNSDFRCEAEKENDNQMTKDTIVSSDNVNNNLIDPLKLSVKTSESESVSLRNNDFETKSVSEKENNGTKCEVNLKQMLDESSKACEDFPKEDCAMDVNVKNESNSNKNSDENQDVEQCNNFKPKSNLDKNKVNDSDNAVDSEVSKLVAHLLHIDNKPHMQEVNVSEAHKDTSKQENHLCKETDTDGKSESSKLLRQRTRPRQSPNSHMKRSCPCCRDSETSSSATKKCRNISSNISKTIRHPSTHWMNVAKTNVNLQTKKSKKPSSVISTRSSKRLRTRSSTVLLT
ncbi:homeobox protein 2-like [Centruroides vittatus]|uniref:homeobox protein 2-like n=1 Tax=Centruroides vittatus TaxID=120091 RepID=UPI00350F0782